MHMKDNSEMNLRMLEICNNYYASPADLYRIFSGDPALKNRLLELTNFLYPGLESPVTSPVRAMIMLGHNTVKNFILTTAEGR